MLRFIVLFSCCVLFTVGDKDCGPNEEMKCVQPCPPERTCRNRDVQFSCKDAEECQYKCACKSGFFRNAVGDCISNEDCDTCQRENEYFACGSACDNECATLDTQNKTNCPITNIVCNRKCYCEDGFARDDKGYCIAIEKCQNKNVKDGPPIVPHKDEAQVHQTPTDISENQNVEDGPSIVPHKDEAQVHQTPTDISENQNVEDGPKIVPNKDGARVYQNPTDFLYYDEKCTGENEVHTDCKKSCPPNTCLSVVARFKCDASEPCKKGCVCAPGYLRQQPKSPCIPICQCSQMKNSSDCKLHDFITKE